MSWFLSLNNNCIFCCVTVFQVDDMIRSLDFVLNLLLQMAAFGRMRVCLRGHHLHVLTPSQLDHDFLHDIHLPHSTRFVKPLIMCQTRKSVSH